MPIARRRRDELHPRFEIRLIEAWKKLIRVGRDEQRIQVLGAVRYVAISNDARTRRSYSRDEYDVYLVLATNKRCGGQSDMRAVVVRRLEPFPVDGDRSEPLATIVENHVTRLPNFESDGCRAA